MKVIFITREGYSLSGARVRCYGFSRELKKYAIKSEVLSFADTFGAKYAENESEMGLTEKLKYNLAAFKLLMKEDKNTVFFLQRINYHVLAPVLVSLIKKNKLIFDCDDWNIRENPKYYFGFLPSSKMEYAYRKLAKRAALSIAASNFLKTYLEPFSRKICYLPTGVDTNCFFPREKTDSSKIVFSWTGTAYNLSMLENLNFILSCFSDLAVEFDNIFLYLAGQGKYYEEFKRTAAISKFSQRIKVFPWIRPDNLPGFLSGIDIGLLPLIQNSYFNQAKSPTKLFEYMAMGKPVVASSMGEAKNIITDGQTGLLAVNRSEFIAKMKLLISDLRLRTEIGRNANEQIKMKYSLNVLGKELYSILRGL